MAKKDRQKALRVLIVCGQSHRRPYKTFGVYFKGRITKLRG